MIDHLDGRDEDASEFDEPVLDWDPHFMRQALGLAEQAMTEDEVPVARLSSMPVTWWVRGGISASP